MEDKYKATGGGGGGGRGGHGGDQSTRTARTVLSGASNGDANGEFDKNGCCILHTHIQVAKRKVFGNGWKVLRACPACSKGGEADEGCDVHSAKYSNKSSAYSRKSSTRSGRPGKATENGRYGALPFDDDGYCCRHPRVQLAKKKALGGFKIIHNECPKCAKDDERKSSKKGGGGRHRSHSRDSRHHHKHRDDGSVNNEPSKRRTKRIRVKNLKTEDDEGRHGRYSGYVNDDHQPHGEGTMKYENGDYWKGVWNEGTKVHGKMRRASGGSR